MLNFKAISKLHSLILVAVIIIATVGGIATYVLLNSEAISSEKIKIGVITDLDGANGKHAWQGALLAAEHLNADGGLFGKQVEVIGEDDDFESGGDKTIGSSGLLRLIAYHNVDFVVGAGIPEYQELIAEHKEIYIAYVATRDDVTQRVTDNYSKYKYFFKYYPANATQLFTSLVDELLFAREMMGFNKVGYLADAHGWTNDIREGLDTVLPDYGFDLVYKGTFPPFDTVDFSSYFAQAEAAGVEILLPCMAFQSGIPFVKEYYDRQSPMVIFGGSIPPAGQAESWEQTGGKCKYITTLILPVTAGYPLTNKTLPFRDAYITRWGESPLNVGSSAYDIIRYLIPDALERAGTMETEAVIKALEKTHIETSLTRNFAFTSNHDVMYEEGMLSDPDEKGFISALFQWQEDGMLVPIYPKQLMDAAGATYIYPDWPGPWD